jgi:hypothetical protein
MVPTGKRIVWASEQDRTSCSRSVLITFKDKALYIFPAASCFVSQKNVKRSCPFLCVPLQHKMLGQWH